MGALSEDWCFDDDADDNPDDKGLETEIQAPAAGYNWIKTSFQTFNSCFEKSFQSRVRCQKSFHRKMWIYVKCVGPGKTNKSLFEKQFFFG